jgi:hypothetical protein
VADDRRRRYILPSGGVAQVALHTPPHPLAVFELPPAVADQLLASAPKGLRALSPRAVREYLARKLGDLARKLGDGKRREQRLASSAWGAMHSADFVLDLLAYSLRDLSGLQPRRGLGGGGIYADLAELYLLPLASAALAAGGQTLTGPSGQPEQFVVASAQQQAMLPSLRERFVSACCVEHAEVRQDEGLVGVRVRVRVRIRG